MSCTNHQQQHATIGGSLLSHLMAETSAGAADVLRFVFAEDNDDYLSLPLRDDGCDNDDNNSTASSTFGNWWNWRGQGDNNHVDTAVEEEHASPVRKKTRTVYARKPQAESAWSLDYLNLTLRDVYIADPHGQDAKKFRRLFRVPYDLFVDLVPMSKERWWQDWTPDKVCNAGKLVSSLELKVLGVLYVLGTGASQYQVSVQTHLSEEVHQVFFLLWLSRMLSISTEYYICMPKTDEQVEFIVGEYSARGASGLCW